MPPSSDTCSICNKPFYGKQKWLYCSGNCGGRVHVQCTLQGGEAATESEFRCKNCTQATGTTDMFRSPRKPSKSSASGEMIVTAVIEAGQPKADVLRRNAQVGTDENIQITDPNVGWKPNMVILSEKLDFLINQIKDLKEENSVLRAMVESVKLIASEPRCCGRCDVSTNTSGYQGKKTYNQAVISGLSSISVARNTSKASQGSQIIEKDVDRVQRFPYGSESRQSSAANADETRLDGASAAADADGFTEFRRRRKLESSEASPATHKQTNKKLVQVGVRNNVNLKTVVKAVRPRMKALFVSRFAPDVEEKEIVAYINAELKVTSLKVAKLKTRHESYSSFYVAVAENDFDRIFNTVFWPAGCLICPFYGRLKDEQIYGYNVTTAEQVQTEKQILVAQTSQSSRSSNSSSIESAAVGGTAIHA